MLISNNLDLTKRDWLLRSLTDLAFLSRQAAELPAYDKITADQFLNDHYAANRPALLTGEIADWPALRLWNPAYLKAKVGGAPIEFQSGRSGDPDYERLKDAHRATMPFDMFIDLIESSGDGNDGYITAYNSAQNGEALAPLAEDLGFIDHLLDPNVPNPNGMMWIGPADTFTPLHHDLTNNLLVQITGSKQVILVPSTEVPLLYNDQHVFSLVQDLEAADIEEFPNLRLLHGHRVELKAGEALFIPLGWWHQIVACDFSVSITYTNFRWRNDFYEGYP